MYRPRTPARRLVLLVLLVAVILPGTRPAAAHRALLIGKEGLDRGSATRITDADIAWAVFGTLPPGAAQYLSFTRPASGQFRARALVATSQANVSLNPWLALVGPGLPRPDGLDGLLADGEGAVLVAPPADREVELFPQAVPWPVLVGASFEVSLPADGIYYLLVFDPSGASGPYIVDTGYLQD